MTFDAGRFANYAFDDVIEQSLRASTMFVAVSGKNRIDSPAPVAGGIGISIIIAGARP
jgi:hypothetical protein